MSNDDALSAAQRLGDHAAVLMNGQGNPVVAYDSVFKGNHTFQVRTLYVDRVSGGYLPGKGLTVPFERRDELIEALVAYTNNAAGLDV